MNGLEGVRVVDLTAYVVAPACPRILGEMGATVYKIEPFTGDEQRTWRASWGMKSETEFDDQAYDLSSMSKQWFNVNLKTIQGLEFVYRPIGDLDIAVTSFRDETLRKLGLDYETLNEKFPHTVSGQMRGYEKRGPEKDSKGSNVTSCSSRGGLVMAFLQKGEHFEPTNVPVAFGDWNASVALTTGISAALVRRLRSGVGDKMMVNLYHYTVRDMSSAVVVSQRGGEYPCLRKEVPYPTNNYHRSKDGIWFLMCFGYYNKHFELVIRVMGLDHLIKNKEYGTLEVFNKTGNNVQMIRWMEEAFEKQGFTYWEKAFKENDIPFQKCFTMNDILNDQETYDNDILRKTPYDSLEEVNVPTSPVRLKSMGDPILVRSRPIGADTRRVVEEYGYSREEITCPEQAGAVKCCDGPPLPENVTTPSYGPGSSETGD